MHRRLLRILHHKGICNWLILAITFAVYLLHAFFFKNWIIDDAGISFVYSRNLAEGYGMVSQPDVAPVEGFSNFTWVMLMTPFFLIKSFSPIVTSKVISSFLVLASFFTIQTIQQTISKRYVLATAFVLFFLAINTSFVIWTTSGLENPLYALLVLLLLWKILQSDKGLTNRTRNTLAIAFIAGLCGLTRPEGIIFSLIFPILLLIDLGTRNQPGKDVSKLLVVYVVFFGLIFGSYVLFRYLYFDDILPNTFYAKAEIPVSSALDGYRKLESLFQSVSIAPLLMVGLLLIFGFLSMVQRRKSDVVLLITMLFTILAYFLLPYDWMPEFRFATPFFALFYIFIFRVGEELIETTRLKDRARLIAAISILGFGIISFGSFSVRSYTFSKQPTVPFASVAEQYSQFDDYALRLGIENGSLLAPDVGGTLYYSHLRVYDLAGLTDKWIAKSIGKDQKSFYDYIFETTKPTFIHTHQWWAYVANLDGDKRFRQDYIAINEGLDEWVLVNLDQKMFSGDYVRKDAIEAHITEFLEMQQETSESD